MPDNNGEESRERLKGLLRELFQFDVADLDFGIYKIMNQRREEIEKFIEKDLMAHTEAAFKEYVGTSSESLRTELEKLKAKINEDFGPGTIDEHGEVKKSLDAPKVRAYLLKQDEMRRAELTRGQIEDVYNQVYEFFNRYFDRGDFFSKRRYGGKDKYVIPYNGEEVKLHWANEDQYYVKTAENFTNYEFRVDGWTIQFLLVHAEVEQNNLKAKERFFILADTTLPEINTEKKILKVSFQYREETEEENKKYAKKNKQEKFNEKSIESILKTIAGSPLELILNKMVQVGEDTKRKVIEKQLDNYVKKNKSDYFIHKDLNGFLSRELDFFIKNEVLHIDEIIGMNERAIRQDMARIMAIQDICKPIIEFLAQIEDFQKMLFEKKKFILCADYCMTLDMVPKEFYPEIAKNGPQISEWKSLFSIGEGPQKKITGSVINSEYLEANPSLVLDTKFYSQDFKDKLLASFENLDVSIGGLIVKSENFQALNLLQRRYEENIDCIYIDPPYNIGSDEFIYKDNYQHSCWIGMMEDRVSLSRSFLHDKGLFFTNIDDCELHRLKFQLDNIFGADNFIDNIIWKKRYGGGSKEKFLVSVHEYMLFYAKNILSLDPIFIPLSTKSIERYYILTDEKVNTRGPYRTHPLEATKSMGDRKNLVYSIPGPDGNDILPKRQWLWEKERALQALHDNEIEFIKSGSGWTVHSKQYLKDESGKLRLAKEFSIIDDIFTQHGTNEIIKLFGSATAFSFPKPTGLLKKILQLASSDGTCSVLDYFAGSGTTAHAVLDLNKNIGGNRKYILVEMGDYFDNVMKPRIEKVMYTSDWNDGKPISINGLSHIFKYITLEQYEDTLTNIIFTSKRKAIQETLLTFEDYFIRYMLDIETRDSPARLALDGFEEPFNYKIVTVSGNEEMTTTVDLVETFNYLIGLHIERIQAAKNETRYYKAIRGKNKDGMTVLIVWRSTKNIELKRDKEFIELTFLKDDIPDIIYANGMCNVKDALPIEPEFKRLMGA